MNTRVDIPIENDDNGNDCTNRYNIAPKMDDDIASHDLKRHKSSLEDEEVPASGDTESIINEASGKSNEWRGDRKVSDHFGNACG